MTRLTIYVVTQDGCFRGSFPTLEEAQAFMAQKMIRDPYSRQWTIDTYEEPPVVPHLSIVRE